MALMEAASSGLAWQISASLRLPASHRSRYFFFQAEDGIRDLTVTGVQTCALPIFAIISNEAIVVGRHSQPGQTQIEEEGCKSAPKARSPIGISTATSANVSAKSKWEIGRASCRERV